MESKNHSQIWEDFLNPDVTRQRLIKASLFIAAYESLKDSIIDRIRMFFCNGFDGNGYKIDPKYDRDVLSLNRSPLYASLTATHDRIKFCRNQLAHRLLNVLGNEGLPPEFDGYFEDMIGCISNVFETW